MITSAELKILQRHANKGDDSAKKYLRLLEACTTLLENADGITQARGLMGEHDDVYMEAIDDALSELVPVVFEIAANGMESIKWYLPDQGISLQKEGDAKQEQIEELRRDLLDLTLMTEDVEVAPGILTWEDNNGNTWSLKSLAMNALGLAQQIFD
jgi:hypothetical protein